MSTEHGHPIIVEHNGETVRWCEFCDRLIPLERFPRSGPPQLDGLSVGVHEGNAGR